MKITQKDRILKYMRDFGSISSWEAYKELGITQLGARIDNLKKEYKEISETNSTRAFILKCQIEILEEIMKGEEK